MLKRLAHSQLSVKSIATMDLQTAAIDLDEPIPLPRPDVLDASDELSHTPSDIMAPEALDYSQVRALAAAAVVSEVESESEGKADMRRVAIEIAIPALSKEYLRKYSVVTSEIVDHVVEQSSSRGGDPSYRIEYTDGREEIVSARSVLHPPQHLRPNTTAP